MDMVLHWMEFLRTEGAVCICVCSEGALGCDLAGVRAVWTTSMNQAGSTHDFSEAHLATIHLFNNCNMVETVALMLSSETHLAIREGDMRCGTLANLIFGIFHNSNKTHAG